MVGGQLPALDGGLHLEACRDEPADLHVCLHGVDSFLRVDLGSFRFGSFMLTVATVRAIE
jgi:hypothetical protein